MGEISDNIRSVSNQSTPDTKSKFSVAQFSPSANAKTRYAGHELDTVQPLVALKPENSPINNNKRHTGHELGLKQSSVGPKSETSPTKSTKRCVCFASKVEVIDPTTSPSARNSKAEAPNTETIGNAAPSSPKKSKKAKKKQAIQNELEAKQELALQKLADNIKAAETGLGALESLNVGEPKRKIDALEAENFEEREEDTDALKSEAFGELEKDFGALEVESIRENEEKARALDHEVDRWHSLKEESLAIDEADIVCVGNCSAWVNCKVCWKNDEWNDHW